MSRKELPLPPESIAPFDLETFTPPAPKAPDHWLSRDNSGPRDRGVRRRARWRGLTWLLGATIGRRFARALGVARGHPLCTLWTAVPLERARHAEPG